MGGYVNLVIKKDHEFEKKLSYTGVISSIVSFEFFEGNKRAIDQVIKMYGFDNIKEETEDPAAGTFAPFDYGLIFVDFDKKHILSLQNHSYLDVVGINNYENRPKIVKFIKSGLAGKSLVNSITREPIDGGEFPGDISKWTASEIMGWLKQKSNELSVVKGDEGETVSLDRVVLPAILLFEGCHDLNSKWHISHFDKDEYAAMFDSLKQAGVTLSEHELGIWQGLKSNSCRSGI